MTQSGSWAGHPAYINNPNLYYGGSSLASLKLMFRCSNRSPKEEKLGGPDAPPETQDLLGFAWFLGKPFGPQCTRSTKRVDQGPLAKSAKFIMGIGCPNPQGRTTKEQK